MCWFNLNQPNTPIDGKHRFWVSQTKYKILSCLVEITGLFWYPVKTVALNMTLKCMRWSISISGAFGSIDHPFAAFNPRFILSYISCVSRSLICMSNQSDLKFIFIRQSYLDCYLMFLLNISSVISTHFHAQSAGAVEYTDCFSA